MNTLLTLPIAVGPLGAPEAAVLMLILLVSVVSTLSRNRVVTLVITKWHAVNSPGEDGLFVRISGRREGIVSWLLSVLGIDATTTLTVSSNRIEFEETSRSGKLKRLIPLSCVCSTVYGYNKPWKKALAIGFLVFIIGNALLASLFGEPGFFSIALSLILGGACGFLYLFLNKHFTLGFIEDSGVMSAIQFKRSLIENQDINETQAGYVSQLVQALIENAINNQPNQTA